MKSQTSRIVILLIPLVFLCWHPAAYSVVTPETQASVAYENGSIILKTYITRAEAAKQFAAALKLPIPAAESDY